MADSDTVTFSFPRIPGYTILQEIGRGGMAVVYLAVQEALQRKVALKVVKESIASDATFTERFIREARMAAGLNHPRILTVHDFGKVNEVHYLVTEYLTGGSLEDRLESGPISIRETLGYLLQISRGLAYAHDHGVIHRDLKPANIFFREGKNTVIGDFGIAKAVGAGDPGLTGVGYMVGTPLYMSPEQIMGKEVDPRSDIYALGIMAYRMITGKAPFSGNPTNIIYEKMKNELPSMSGVPGPIQDLVDNLCAINPDDRPRNAEAVVSILEGLLSSGSPSPQKTLDAQPTKERPAWSTLKRITPAKQKDSPRKPRAQRAVVFRVTAAVLVVGVAWAVWALFGGQVRFQGDPFAQIDQFRSDGEYAKATDAALAAARDASTRRRANSILRGLPAACLNHANTMIGIDGDYCGAQKMLIECAGIFKDNEALRAAADEIVLQNHDC